MSLRPRFAGDGRLRLPDWVSILRVGGSDGDAGDIIGELGARVLEPFERTAEGLLLAEEFARFDFERPRKAQQWYREHGVLDLAHLFPDDYGEGSEDDTFQDPLVEVLEQQRVVAWHLMALARLSVERERAEPPRSGWQPHEGWDPAWSQPALQDSSGAVVWLGAASTFAARITPQMQQYASFDDLPKPRSLDEYTLDGLTPREFTTKWWPRAHAAWERITTENIPVLWVPSAVFNDLWEDYDLNASEPDGRMSRGRLSADWHGLVELERRMLGPYIRKAAMHEVYVGRRVTINPSADGEALTYNWDGPIEVNEHRWWRSLLAPLYLQLLEALRRISEGHSGAALCRECGRPFLTLDARRSSFCNDRERFRFTQRERRRRLAMPPSNAKAGMPL